MSNVQPKPQKRVLVIRLSPELERKRSNPNYMEIAVNTLAAMKSGKITTRTDVTDFEKRAAETCAILRKAGRK